MRLFLAIDFNELKDNLVAIQSKIGKSTGNLKEVTKFHLTLKFLGEVSEDNASQIKDILKKVKFNAFNLSVDKIGVFPNENYVRVIWIGVKPDKEVKALQDNVENALKEFNFKKDFQFHPHITLARVKFIKDKEKFIKNLKEIKVEPKTIEIKQFKLIKSTLTPKGPVYEDVEVFS